MWRPAICLARSGTTAPVRYSPPNPPTPLFLTNLTLTPPPFPLPAGHDHPAHVITVTAARQARCMHRTDPQPSLGPSPGWMSSNRKMRIFRMSTITSDRVLSTCNSPDTVYVGPRTIDRRLAAVQIAAILSQLPFNTDAVFPSDWLPYARSLSNERIFTKHLFDYIEIC